MDMFLYSNLLPSRTGLKYQVWYSGSISGHVPEIMVDVCDKHVFIEIESHQVSGDVEVLSDVDMCEINRWIDLNKEILLKYWNESHTGTIDSGDVMDSVQPI